MTVKLVNRGTEGEYIIAGRLDTATAPQIEKIFNETAAPFTNIILNMQELEYISSAGLRVIKIMHVTMKKKGGELVLTNVNRLVAEVFEMTGFSQLIRIIK